MKKLLLLITPLFLCLITFSQSDTNINQKIASYEAYLLTISSTVALAIRNNHLKKNPDQERFVYDATLVISGSMLFVSLITNLASIKEKKKAGLLLNQNGIGLKIDL